MATANFHDPGQTEKATNECGGGGGPPSKSAKQPAQTVRKTAQGRPGPIPRWARGARRGSRNPFKHGAYTAEHKATRRLINRLVHDAERMIAWLESTRKGRTPS